MFIQNRDKAKIKKLAQKPINQGKYMHKCININIKYTKIYHIALIHKMREI